MSKQMIPPGWTASGKGHTRKYRHASGWLVFHCGHPTALWPWGVHDPDGRMHTSGDACHLGFAFGSVWDALAHAEAHLRAEGQAA